MTAVLGVLVEVIRQVAILVQPVMPASAERLLDQLMLTSDERSFAVIGGQARLPEGRQIGQPSGVFPRFIEDESQ